jgi:hypothetical protein
LSTALAGTLAWQLEFAFVVTFRHAATGAVFVCATVTVKEQTLVLPEVSVAMQFTVVVPIGKMEPDGGETLVEATPQLSVTVGPEKFTTALVCACGTLVMMFAGQAMVGANVSRTVMVKLQFVPFAEVHVTVLVPFAKKEPEGGEQLIAPQFPLVLGIKFTTAPH